MFKHKLANMNRIILIFIVFVFTSFVNNSDKSQIINTSLRITVLDDLGNRVEGASENIYSNESDYREEVNPVMEEKLTDTKGRVTFKKLQSTKYFVLVKKGDLNNVGGGVEVNLDAKKLNKVNIIIE